MPKRKYLSRRVRLALRAREWKQMQIGFVKWRRKMSSNNQYDLVPNDDYDLRIPLHPEEAFKYGITFQAKYIGTMEVPRPSTRIEIVAAMRRVRYEFKSKGVKKRKVTVDISTDGVRITARKIKAKRRSILFNRDDRDSDTEEGAVILHHPIYRIFYVSHDSSDLKIFSYIARDGSTNEFKCNVFKSKKRSQAMKIVRTVGQAFEVCHKLHPDNPDQPVPSTSSAADEEQNAECGSNATFNKGPEPVNSGRANASIEEIVREEETLVTGIASDQPAQSLNKTNTRQPKVPTESLLDLPECVSQLEEKFVDLNFGELPFSGVHRMQLLQERLELESQQCKDALTQVQLLTDQLAAEQKARREAQARTHQLLIQNKELLEHISILVSHLQEHEQKCYEPISAKQLTRLPQLSSRAKIDRWFSRLSTAPALSRPESGFISGVDDVTTDTVAAAKKLLLRMGAKKKRRLLPIRFSRRKVMVNKYMY